jgi:hypothetical protein
MKVRRTQYWLLVVALCAFAGRTDLSVGFEGEPSAGGPRTEKAPPPIVPLNKQKTVLLDVAGKRLLLKTKVVLHEGVLEMLCCLTQTKEHESILAVDAKAYVIHAGLLSLGAKPGKPVQFDPKFQPPTGQAIDVFLQWSDKDSKLQRVRAQDWIRTSTRRFHTVKMEQAPSDLKIPKGSELFYDKKHHELSWFGQMSKGQRTELLKLSKLPEYQKAVRSFHELSQPRPMKADWVFAGSNVFTDEQSGEQYYEAEVGDLICVANFPSAMLDIAISSSATGEANLLYEADTAKIPPLDTEVTVELIPVFKKTPGKGKTSAGNNTEGERKAKESDDK